MKKQNYKCSECGLVVIVDGEDLIKACNCEASVIAEMTATATGSGGLKQ
jgi:hypothetical protein